MLNVPVSFTGAVNLIISDVYRPVNSVFCSVKNLLQLRNIFAVLLSVNATASANRTYVFFFLYDQESRTCSVPSGGVLVVGCRIPQVSVRSRPQTKASDSAWLKGSPCPSRHLLSCPDRRTWWRLARARSLQVGYSSFYQYKSMEMSGHQQLFGWGMGCVGFATAVVL